MTKKRFKVWDKNNWGEVTWKDSRLEQLVYQASRLGGYSRNYVYKITTPIPPVLASQQENYSMVQTVTRHRFSKEIAEETIATQGAFAHLYALSRIDDMNHLTGETDAKLWRDVLTWLDELGGDDARGNQRGDNPEPRSEQTDSAREDS